jgi:L-asparaginase II
MEIKANILRGDEVESRHSIYAVVVDEGGTVLWQAGDANFPTCVRSTLKPFQASAAVLDGATEAAGFTTEELALMCASHSGEDKHLKLARSMMNKLGLGPEAYECGAHLPFHPDARWALIRAKQKPTPFHNNCSGKHAGMLALAKHLKVDYQGYTRPDHPVQKAIFKQVRKFAEVNTFTLGTDGCSAPVPFLPLVSIARMYQKLVEGTGPELQVLYEAMTTHPYLVGGTKRFDTDFMMTMAGNAVSKTGGEGVRGIGLRTSAGKTVGIAIKILDGNQRCSAAVTLAILKHLNLITEQALDALETYAHPILRNHRKIVVGRIEVEINSA